MVDRVQYQSFPDDPISVVFCRKFHDKGGGCFLSPFLGQPPYVGYLRPFMEYGVLRFDLLDSSVLIVGID
jgi:hypothetical protein